MKPFHIYAFLLLLFISAGFAENGRLHHGLEVIVDPQMHHLQVTDTLYLPTDGKTSQWRFLLNNNLTVRVLTPNVSLEVVEKNISGKDVGMDVEEPQVTQRVLQNRYLLRFKSAPKAPVARVVLRYEGMLNYPVEQLSEEYARGFSTTPGIISEQGVYLAGSSDWIPYLNDQLFTFRLKVQVPEKWDVVSQGKRLQHLKKGENREVTWLCTAPMEEVFLIAAPFVQYERLVGNVHVQAFLRSADEALANKYLEVTGQYLEMYRQLIGPYPFWKFALVENFWETGYGMPSFTLLGPQVIRFPFILHSSYPHELLHNWWGNSAYVDFSEGNWCEGLTAYLADHLIQEQRGQGDAYRRSTLQKFTDYVNPQNDFPLKDFRSRYNAPSEAIGYGKCLMLFDMLREDVGDKTFVRALQKFYAKNKFKRASFSDWREVFESLTGKDYQWFFDQWLNRTGAPQLELKNVNVVESGKQFTLQFTLQQVQDAKPFRLNVPVAISFANGVEIKKVLLADRAQTYSFQFDRRPLLIQIDPQYHVFRRLHYNEIPPALSKIFGAKKVLIVLPDGLPEQSPYRKLASIWAKSRSKKVQVVTASQIKELPADQAIWLFGKDNPLIKKIASALKAYGAEISNSYVMIEQAKLPYQDRSFVLTVRHPKNPQSVVVWLSIGHQEAVKGLARKLPHYGKYSYLAFEGAEPSNILKGQWPAVHSPLRRELPRANAKPDEKLPKRPPLTRLAPLFSAQRMLKDVKFLADPALEGRGLGTAGLEKAARYIARAFEEAGLQPAADDGTFFQTWQDVINAKGEKGTLRNVIAMIPGSDPQLSTEAVVVSAHYDHLGYGWPDVHKGDECKIHPGADDNASGVAVLLELARTLGGHFKPLRTVIFIAFSGEENGLKGSQYFVSNYRRFPHQKIYANLNLDTVGRLNGNKVLILNANSAREWPFIFMGIGYVTGVQAQMVTQKLDASDQVSFIEAGIPAVQIFSGPNEDYHRPTDTFDKIDGNGLVKIATLTKEALTYLAADRKEPLTFLGGKAGQPTTTMHGKRKVRSGIIPDFAFDQTGVKIQSISADSPAARAGLKPGDVIIAFDQQPVKNLRDYSEYLKQHKVGDEVTLKILRGGKELNVRLKLESR